MFREVALPNGVNGALYLHSMPGRYEEFQRAVSEMRRLRINRIVSLAPHSEIQAKSPLYARAIEEGNLPCLLVACPITDMGIPDDMQKFLISVDETAAALRARERLLLHCGAGIGRTGTYAASVLIRLEMDKEEALARVEHAGSLPETDDQRKLLDYVANS